MGKNHVKKRKRLAADLKIAQDKVHFLEEKLMLLEVENDTTNRDENDEIRIFMDGAFDMMHYGHMNAFRLARSLASSFVRGPQQLVHTRVAQWPAARQMGRSGFAAQRHGWT